MDPEIQDPRDEEVKLYMKRAEFKIRRIAFGPSEEVAKLLDDINVKSKQQIGNVAEVWLKAAVTILEGGIDGQLHELGLIYEELGNLYFDKGEFDPAINAYGNAYHYLERQATESRRSNASFEEDAIKAQCYPILDRTIEAFGKLPNLNDSGDTLRLKLLSQRLLDMGYPPLGYMIGGATYDAMLENWAKYAGKICTVTKIGMDVPDGSESSYFEELYEAAYGLARSYTWIIETEASIKWGGSTSNVKSSRKLNVELQNNSLNWPRSN